ncbi:hypothetical protein H2199_008100 [Coniosporium tulheliwenetii]|uniref:Uncharacterized protein n=1 Tax=Coniosporium tulheliwenetii TaxID=3383036 RepID=A0ACC2YMQ9_9PEZI|nr:hypothetical protein H2199_008100 [Cladosporium sp. JES 115]
MCMRNFLQSCLGASLGNDQRQSQGNEYYEYWIALLPQKDVEQLVMVDESIKPAESDARIEHVAEKQIDLEELGETSGYVVDLGLINTVPSAYGQLKTAADGHTILIPQPSDDPVDPLNWSWARKHAILFTIAAIAFLPDYGSATGAVTLLPQAQIWGMSEDHVNHSQVGNVFMLGAGGLFVVALSAYFGRLPVLFWFTATALWTAAWCTAATTFEPFMAARILNGFFSTVAQGGGLMFIKDMFFFHEHARKINIWAAFIILSPYFGPLIAAFIISTQKWQWAFGVYTIETGLCLIAVVIFVDETFYDRKLPHEQRIPRKSKLQRLVGIEQWRSRHQRSTFKQAVMRPVRVICKPVVLLSSIYYMLTFAWDKLSLMPSINTTLAIFVTPLYGFGPRQIGFFYFTPVIGAILGEICGHWLHDKVASVITRCNKGTFQPEYRLAAIWLSTPFILTGLVMLGFALENAWHYMVAAVGWGLYVFGIMITTVAITAYNLDAYPEGSGEVAAWINMARTTGGFIISYFQMSWAQSQGTKRSFGIQAAVCLAGFFIVVFLQVYGAALRKRSGPLHFKTG